MLARRTRVLVGDALAVALLSLAGCDRDSTAPAPPPPAPQASYDPEWAATRDRDRRRGPADHATAAPRPREPAAASASEHDGGPGDPLGGVWSIDQALEGLPREGDLVATIRTDLGEIRCQLWPDRAPNAVASFVGLARGLRPWRTPEGRWERRPAYDGSRVSRIVPGVLVQGGSPDGTADRGPGYVIADEIWPGARHDRAGLLCMAGDGPDRGGMQFAITLGGARHLDRRFTIFGLCAPLSVIDRIGAVATDRGRPLAPIRIESVRIGRHR